LLSGAKQGTRNAAYLHWKIFFKIHRRKRRAPGGDFSQEEKEERRKGEAPDGDFLQEAKEFAPEGAKFCYVRKGRLGVPPGTPSFPPLPPVNFPPFLL
jgi:hypothetical protein